MDLTTPIAIWFVLEGEDGDEYDDDDEEDIGGNSQVQNLHACDMFFVLL